MRNERFQQTWSEYTCQNGLRLVLFQKPQFYTSAFMMMTPFGNLDHIQKGDDGRIYTAPSGTAHFLEHKLFESGNEDVMLTFNRLGASVNASTSYEQTAYFFSTPAEEISEPLILLLDFVQNLSITQESVAKEQQIILEELAMYQQDPDSRLFIEAMKAIYHSHPLRDDIVGSERSISATTKEDLEAAYERNYHPSRMTLIGITPADPNKLIDLIESNQQNKPFNKPKCFYRYLETEPTNVCAPFVTVTMDIERPRCAVCFKLPLFEGAPNERLRQEWVLRLSMEAVFSPVNPKFQDWIDDGRITPYFSYDIDLTEDSAFLYFQDETSEAQMIREFVMETLESMKKEAVRSEDLRQMRQRMVGTIIRVMDNPLDMISSWSRGVLRKVNIFEECEIVESIEPEDCRQMMQKISLNHYSCVILVPERE